MTPIKADRTWHINANYFGLNDPSCYAPAPSQLPRDSPPCTNKACPAEREYRIAKPAFFPVVTLLVFS